MSDATSAATARGRRCAGRRCCPGTTPTRRRCRRSSASPCGDERSRTPARLETSAPFTYSRSVGAVIGRREVRPGVQRQRAPAGRGSNGVATCALGRSSSSLPVERVAEAAGLLLQQRRSAREPKLVGLTQPSIVMPPRRSSEGVGDRDQVVEAVEAQRRAEAPAVVRAWRRRSCRVAAARPSRPRSRWPRRSPRRRPGRADRARRLGVGGAVRRGSGRAP